MTIFGVKKVVFWPFSKLFWSCLSICFIFKVLKHNKSREINEYIKTRFFCPFEKCGILWITLDAYYSSQQCFIPQRDSAKAEPLWGQFDSLSILLWSRQGCLTFDIFNLQTEIRLFEILKMFYPPKRLCESRTRMGSI